MLHRVPFVVAFFVLSSLFAGTGRGQAQSASNVFTLQPGEIATITFESFCIDYGKAFPGAVGLPETVVADAAIQGAVGYAFGKRYTAAKPNEVQFAIWELQAAVGSPATGAEGKEIIANVQAAALPLSGPASVLDAMRDGRLKASMGTFGGIGEKITLIGYNDYYQGRGELIVENIASEAQTLYLPVGTLFPAPGPEYQNMVGYQAGIQISNLQPTATLPQPTATTVPATATTAPATATPIPATATPVPATATTVPATATVEQPTATFEQPTATVAQPTATVEQSTVAPSPTTPAAGQVLGVDTEVQELPNTGGIELTTVQTIILILLGVDVVILGFSLRRRA